MGRIHLTDRQWTFIRPFLPLPARTGRPRAADRQIIEGILYVLITGCRWRDLPRAYGAPTTVCRRLKRWEHLSSVYRSFFTVAVLLMCLRRVCLLPTRVGVEQAMSPVV